MKVALVALVALCAGVAAHAYPTPRSSWEQIKNDRSVRFLNLPLVNTLGENGILNACVEGDVFKSVEDVKTCVATAIGKERVDNGEGSSYEREYTYCTQYQYLPVTVARAHKQSVCAEWKQVNDGENSRWECVKTKEVDAVFGTKFNIDVYIEQGGEAGLNYAFTKAFEVPACK